MGYKLLPFLFPPEENPQGSGLMALASLYFPPPILHYIKNKNCLMLFINYTLADEKYISSPPPPRCPLLPPTPAPSPFLPQEPKRRPEEYGFAF